MSGLLPADATLTVRDGPNISGAQIGLIGDADVVVATTEWNGWLRIAWEGGNTNCWCLQAMDPNPDGSAEPLQLMVTEDERRLQDAAMDAEDAAADVGAGTSAGGAGGSAATSTSTATSAAAASATVATVVAAGNPPSPARPAAATATDERNPTPDHPITFCFSEAWDSLPEDATLNVRSKPDSTGDMVEQLWPSVTCQPTATGRIGDWLRIGPDRYCLWFHAGSGTVLLEPAATGGKGNEEDGESTTEAKRATEMNESTAAKEAVEVKAREAAAKVEAAKVAAANEAAAATEAAATREAAATEAAARKVEAVKAEAASAAAEEQQRQEAAAKAEEEKRALDAAAAAAAAAATAAREAKENSVANTAPAARLTYVFHPNFPRHANIIVRTEPTSRGGFVREIVWDAYWSVEAMCRVEDSRGGAGGGGSWLKLAGGNFIMWRTPGGDVLLEERGAGGVGSSGGGGIIVGAVEAAAVSVAAAAAPDTLSSNPAYVNVDDSVVTSNVQEEDQATQVAQAADAAAAATPAPLATMSPFADAKTYRFRRETWDTLPEDATLNLRQMPSSAAVLVGTVAFDPSYRVKAVAGNDQWIQIIGDPSGYLLWQTGDGLVLLETVVEDDGATGHVVAANEVAAVAETDAAVDTKVATDTADTTSSGADTSGVIDTGRYDWSTDTQGYLDLIGAAEMEDWRGEAGGGRLYCFTDWSTFPDGSTLNVRARPDSARGALLDIFDPRPDWTGLATGCVGSWLRIDRTQSKQQDGFDECYCLWRHGEVMLLAPIVAEEVAGDLSITSNGTATSFGEGKEPGEGKAAERPPVISLAWVDKLTVKQLKAELTAVELKQTGLKASLKARLLEHLDKHPRAGPMSVDAPTVAATPATTAAVFPAVDTATKSVAVASVDTVVAEDPAEAAVQEAVQVVTQSTDMETMETAASGETEKFQRRNAASGSFGSIADERPLKGGSPKERPLTGASPKERPLTGASPKERPLTGASPMERPLTGTPKERPLTGGSPKERPLTGASPKERPLTGTPKERPLTGSLGAETKSSDVLPVSSPSPSSLTVSDAAVDSSSAIRANEASTPREIEQKAPRSPEDRPTLTHAAMSPGGVRGAFDRDFASKLDAALQRKDVPTLKRLLESGEAGGMSGKRGGSGGPEKAALGDMAMALLEVLRIIRPSESFPMSPAPAKLRKRRAEEADRGGNKNLFGMDAKSMVAVVTIAETYPKLARCCFVQWARQDTLRVLSLRAGAVSVALDDGRVPKQLTPKALQVVRAVYKTYAKRFAGRGEMGGGSDGADVHCGDASGARGGVTEAAEAAEAVGAGEVEDRIEGREHYSMDLDDLSAFFRAVHQQSSRLHGDRPGEGTTSTTEGGASWAQAEAARLVEQYGSAGGGAGCEDGADVRTVLLFDGWCLFFRDAFESATRSALAYVGAHGYSYTLEVTVAAGVLAE
jgi:hypothetical protein